MDGQEIMGRAVKVDFAKENPDRIQAREDALAGKTEEIPEY
jgi:hypothetical protein